MPGRRREGQVSLFSHLLLFDSVLLAVLAFLFLPVTCDSKYSQAFPLVTVASSCSDFVVCGLALSLLSLSAILTRLLPKQAICLWFVA